MPRPREPPLKHYAMNTLCAATPASLVGAGEVPGGQSEGKHDPAKQQHQEDDGGSVLVLCSKVREGGGKGELYSALAGTDGRLPASTPSFAGCFSTLHAFPCIRHRSPTQHAAHISTRAPLRRTTQAEPRCRGGERVTWHRPSRPPATGRPAFPCMPCVSPLSKYTPSPCAPDAVGLRTIRMAILLVVLTRSLVSEGLVCLQGWAGCHGLDSLPAPPRLCGLGMACQALSRSPTMPISRHVRIS